MKSLALHLMTIVLLGSLHTNADKDTATLQRFEASTQFISTTTRTRTTATTTIKPPSLLAPNRRVFLFSTTAVVPTKTTTTTTLAPKSNINRRRQHVESSLFATTASSRTKAKNIVVTESADTEVGRREVAHAKIMTQNNDINNRRLQQQQQTQQRQDFVNSVITTTTTPKTMKFSSTRLARDVVDKIDADVARSANQASNVRQNRSLQSGDTTLQQQQLNNDNANNNNSNNDDDYVYSRYKYRLFDQRQRFRSNLNEENNRNNNNNADKQRVNEIDQKTKVQHDANKSIEREPSSAVRNFTKTSKTPRMIERLVAGHIQNAESRSKFEVSSVTVNSTVTNSSTTHKPTAIYFRRKQPMLSSSYRETKLGVLPMLTTTTTSRPQALNNDVDNDSDDEALLEDPGDFDNWDNGILRLSAGSGKETAKQSKKNKEDSKKTLSDQVRDGKYGLIEKELFQRAPKRPGVLSYLANKEVPIDNERTFGGLNEEDIWLAEDHLLIIKGGNLNEGEPSEPWPPIDDYDAPGRQIKIPENSKVPPPFPVQLDENGPIQFIGNNKFTVVYPVTNETIPVYTAGDEKNYTTSENIGNNEKNFIARPGSFKNATQGEPSYIYPAPYPPWLYHNQTFVNPFLSNARHITFPGLGPFPLGRHNNTMSKIINGSEPFDEDDPSLYYPPAYSFVYKNNYTNPVAPGPLVPGIVLPPPPNHFSRLEKPDKTATTSTTTAVPTLSSRYRIYPTSTTTTTTTTNNPPTTSTTTSSITSNIKTSTTTTESPFRHAITKISQYTPKTIIITPAPPVSTTKLSISPPRTPSTIKISKAASPTLRPQLIEPVPVPVAVPIPIYPINSFSPVRTNVVTLVPTTGSPTVVDTLSKSHPIYYEYFEAKRQPSTVHVIGDFLSSTTAKSPPAVSKPSKQQRPFKHSNTNSGNRHYLQPQSVPNRQYVPENVVYITPKPEVRFKAQPPIFKQRPLDNFERDVNSIRQNLRLYQNQQLRDNSIPRIPKAKTIYEYSFDATKSVQKIEESSSSFQPPVEFDMEPFKPMVTYSPPVDDENSFRAIAYDKSDNSQQNQQESKQQQINKYQSSTTLVPVQTERDYAGQQGRSKQLRLSAKYAEQPLPESYVPQEREQQQKSEFGEEYQTTQRTILTTQAPWVSVDNSEQYAVQRQQKQAQQQQQQQMQRHLDRSQIPPPIIAFNNPGFAGYYYRPIQQVPPRQNNRFYDQPFTNNVRKTLNYHRPQSVWSLGNDTLVNYLPNRPPINPDAEYIDPYIISGYATGPSQRPASPPLSHQSQYYVPPQRVQPPPLRQPVEQQHIPLHRDILVNYRQPLPPINPDSEFISHTHVVRNQGNQIVYRPNQNYGLSPPNANQPSIFYITPKYRRSNNMPLDNNNHNNRNVGNNAAEHEGI